MSNSFDPGSLLGPLGSATSSVLGAAGNALPSSSSIATLTKVGALAGGVLVAGLLIYAAGVARDHDRLTALAGRAKALGPLLGA